MREKDWNTTFTPNDDIRRASENGMTRAEAIRIGLTIALMTTTLPRSSAASDAEHVGPAAFARTGLHSTSTNLLSTVQSRDYAVGNGKVDDTSNLRRAAAAARNGTLVISPGTYKLSGTIDLSSLAPITVRLAAGAKIVQHANTPVFRAQGSLSSGIPLLASAMNGSRKCAVRRDAAPPVDSIVLVASKDTALNSKDKLGYLRRVTAVSRTANDTITFERPLPRALHTAHSAQLRAASMIPGVVIEGKGRVLHADSGNTRTLVELILCRSPRVSIEIGPSGGAGVTFAHCLGGRFDGYVHDLRDSTLGGHFGYGVNVSGASRDMTIRGIGRRCRHAFTTNVGPNIPNSAHYGEPENIHVYMITSDCSNKALDTHRPGWGIVFHPSHVGGRGGGLQIRADNTAVVGGTISDTGTVGIGVSPLVTIPAIISGTAIRSITGSAGTGILLSGPAIVRNVQVRQFSGTGILVKASNCSINNAYIDGVRKFAGLRGIEIRGKNTRLTGKITRVGIGLRFDASKTDNDFSRLVYTLSVKKRIQQI